MRTAKKLLLAGVTPRGGVPAEVAASRIADFEDDTIGAHPVGWTTRLGTAATFTVETTSDSTKGVAYANGGFSRSPCTWDELDNVSADIDALMRIDAILNGSRNEIIVRGSGTTSTDVTAYIAYPMDANTLKIGKYVNGTYTEIASSVTTLGLTDGWMLCRFQVIGNALKYKAWNEGTTEPGWILEITDSDVSNAGWNGIFHYDSAGTPVLHVDWFSVGLDGDAPVAP